MSDKKYIYIYFLQIFGTPPVHKLIPTDKRDHIFLQKFDHHNSQ